MSQQIDLLKEKTLKQLIGLCRQRLEPALAGPAERMVRVFYANVAPEDFLKRDLESLYGAALGVFGFALQRRPQTPKLRVYGPSQDDSGWHSAHGAIEIINDDMPFLVDSIMAALAQRDIGVHLVIHPILSVVRDAEGRLTDVLSAPTELTRQESVMQIEIDRSAVTDTALAKDLLAVLADVRAGVEDWVPMRHRVLDVLAEFDRLPDAFGQEEVEEARAFLTWVHDDFFTFLGYRSIRFDGPEGGAVHVDADTGLGLFRDPTIRLFDVDRDLSAFNAEVQDFLRRPNLLLLTKADRVSTVHRAVRFDIVGVKRFDAAGRVIGLHVVVGLFTHAAYALSAQMVPLLRGKLRRIVERAGFPPASHDGKALLAILENHPRDELLQASEESLYEIALGILRLQERGRVALFQRRDSFGRFVSVMIFVPRDRFDTRYREKAADALEDAYGGKVIAWYTQLGESPLARLYVLVKTNPDGAASVDVRTLEARLADMARSWVDRLHEVLVERYGEERGLALFRRWGNGFPASYCETESPRTALSDVARLEALDGGAGVGLHLHRPATAPESELRFKILRRDAPVALSDVLPLFEHIGFRVIAEVPNAVHDSDGAVVWLQDFTMATRDGRLVEIDSLRDRFENTFRALWEGKAEDDGFNQLVVDAGLDWRQVVVLRAYSHYLRQAGAAFSLAYIEKTLVRHPAIAGLLVRLFETRFDPDRATESPSGAPALEEAILAALDKVTSADEDRILRRLLNLIDSTLRTNCFQTDSAGKPKDYLSFKLDSRQVEGLPLPRPMVEIFVYSPRMEGIHLRGGKVARGGIRWSDRPEDFRTEILGLLKAQMVKNAVIVPVGSKGGFVVKRPPTTGDRDAYLQEGIACYKTLMRGLLDLTDNRVAGAVVAPARVVRRDEDDSYLVVAADKGTATFSDIANGISLEYGFWLGDAFASGGSQGYDHKIMGITARGAWESVKRHFREMGRDIQREPFTVVGIGDMSGDVFGNGLLRSPCTQLLAAFDHRHIFLDPNPDMVVSFAERQIMFARPRSSWADYDATKISPGGGVYPRDAKTIPLSAEVRARFSIVPESLPPAELIRILLCAEVDLLWFGGIGTFIKATQETHMQAGDRANDSLRIDARALRCKVVGEGANLGITQLARIEAGLAGVRLNTDAIDNSAGVDCSDHEVNIKILLNAAVADGDLTVKQRNQLLVAMTEDVGALVLRDNYLQTQALSIIEAQAGQSLDNQGRFIHLLERAGRLDPSVEFLPTDEEMTRRAAVDIGLTRPEAAVLFAYAKLWLYDAVVASDLPDDPVLFGDLLRYFPTLLQADPWRARLGQHPLAREIIATAAVNSMVNRIDVNCVPRLMERFGCRPDDVVRAYLAVRDVFDVRDVWSQIEGLDGVIPAKAQTSMLIEVNRLLERSMAWVLAHAPDPLEIGSLLGGLESRIVALRAGMSRFLPPATEAAIVARVEDYKTQGVPADLSRSVSEMIVLAATPDIALIAAKAERPEEEVAAHYFLVSTRFGLGLLRAAAERLPRGSQWQKRAIEAVIDDLYAHQTALTHSVVATGLPPDQALDFWIASRRQNVDRAEQILGELRTTGTPDLATLVVASYQFRQLAEG